jgi:creatinine amidohydrolase
MERRLGYLNHLEFKGLVPVKIDTVVIPVGTIEAHGVTPLATDVIIPETMAKAVGEEINALIAPAVPYGITRGLAGHPGTITITPEVFKAYIGDILASMASHGFRQIIVLNGHGGQTTELKDVLFETSRKTGVKTLLIEWWYGTDDIREQTLGREGGHAGSDETACIMAIDSSLVKPELFDENQVAFQSRAYSAYPVPGSIVVYTEGDWSLNLDQAKCSAFYEAVTERTIGIIKDVLAKWSLI